MNISVVISVHNGEETFADCLASVQSFADEIIVMNHDSSDKTESIAKRFTEQVFTIPNNPDEVDLQKNTGFEKAKGIWILSLDADEQVTKELSEELTSITKKDTVETGYFIPRKNMLFGKWMEHTGWYPDYQLRFFQRGKGKYTKVHVHEDLNLSGSSGKLKGHIIHQNYSHISQFLTRAIFTYAPNEAKEKLQNGYTFSYVDAIRFPLQEFLSRFFARNGYKDGFHGLMLSFLMAFYHFIIFCYLWEETKFKDTLDSSLMLAQKELGRAEKEFRYWVQTKKIEETNNPIQKIALKGKRKLDSL